MTDKPDRVTEIIEQLRKRNRDEASRRNSAYDYFGMDNTPESVDPTAWAAADLLEALTTRSQGDIRMSTMTNERRDDLIRTCNRVATGEEPDDTAALATVVREILRALPVTDERELPKRNPQ